MYLKILETAFKREFAYKHNVFFTFIGAILMAVVSWYLWTAIFNSSPETTIAGFTLSAMLTYVIVSVAMSRFQRNFIDYLVEFDVRHGGVAIALIRPYKYPLSCFFTEMGRTLFSFFLLSLPIMIFGIVFFNIPIASNLLIFAVSTFLGFIINFSIAFLTGLWAFWSTGSIWGLRHSRMVIMSFFSGMMIPLSFFPGWLKTVADFLPFKSVYSTPLLIYIGKLSGEAMYFEMLQQLVWVVVLSGICYIVWKKAENKTISVGG